MWKHVLLCVRLATRLLRDNNFDKNKLNVTLHMKKCILDAIQHQFSYKN